MKVKSLSRARLLSTPGTAAYQAPPSMGFCTGVGCHCLLQSLVNLQKCTDFNGSVYGVLATVYTHEANDTDDTTLMAESEEELNKK